MTANDGETDDVDEERLHRVVAVDELGDGDRVVIEVRGRDIAIFNLDGEYRAVGDHCPHMGGPCAEGLVTGRFGAGPDGELSYNADDKVISCPWHGWEFDIETGEHIAGTKKRLLTYEVVRCDDTIYVVV